MSNIKVFVPVRAYFDADGRHCPLEVVWEDGRRYQFDKVIGTRQAAASKAGAVVIGIP